MRIDHLVLKNFRCFEECAFDLAPQFNVMIGQNGSGKTALLEALSIAAGSWLLGLKGARPQPIRPKDVRVTGHKSDGALTFTAQYPVEVTAEGWIEGKAVGWSRSLSAPEGKTSHSKTKEIKQIAEEADRLMRASGEIVLPIVAYYGTGRLWHVLDLSHARNADPKRELARYAGYENAFAERINASELARWMEFQDRIKYQYQREPTRYQAVRQAMKQMIGQAVDVRFDNQRLEIVVEFANGSIQPFANLSDGQRNLIALGGDIAMRMARLNPQFGVNVTGETPGIILIDELDLHLHPDWQRSVASDLMRTFPKAQFVTTTHSPQIISEIEPRNLLFLVQDEQKFSVLPGTQAYGLDTNWILEHIMNVPSRPEAAKRSIARVEDALEEGDLDEARVSLQDLRRLLHGDDGAVARLEASINNLEALADEVYSEAR